MPQDTEEMILTDTRVMLSHIQKISTAAAVITTPGILAFALGALTS